MPPSRPWDCCCRRMPCTLARSCPPDSACCPQVRPKVGVGEHSPDGSLDATREELQLQPGTKMPVAQVKQWALVAGGVGV